MAYQEKSVFTPVSFLFAAFWPCKYFQHFIWKKILFDTSNRSKILQLVFEIWQFYEKNIAKKLHQIWCIFLGLFSVNLLYFENYLEYLRSVWSAKKYFFSNKMLKIFAWPKGCTQKTYWCLKMHLIYKKTQKSTCTQTNR